MKTNLYRIGLWAEDKGLVGEKETFITGAIVCAASKPMGFGLEAPAGSGKTVAADLLLGDGDNIEGLVHSTSVYYKDAGSQTSFFRDADKINMSDIIFVRELQKDKSHDTVEAIKSITEGKSAGRRRVDVTDQDDMVKMDKIKARPVVYTLAIENDTKPDAELRRRFITMSTDVSKEQTGRVLSVKAKKRFDKLSGRVLTDDESDKVKKDYNSIRKMKFRVLNPFAEEFAQIMAEIAPDQKVRSMAEHFWDVMDGVTKLNYVEGRVAVGNDGLTLIANVQDLFQTLDVYKDAFMRDVYSIPPLGDIILRGFREAGKVEQSAKKSDLAQYTSELAAARWIDINHLRKSIKEQQKVVLAKNVVIQICKQLVDAGYLEDYKDGQTTLYQVQQEFREFENPDWSQLVEQAAQRVKEKYPDKFEQWYDMQWKSYQHPITGEEVKYG
jgi:hypothetical protein